MVERSDPAEELAAFAKSSAGDERTPVVVIAGCGTAGTVSQLREYGVDAYGFDNSAVILESVADAIQPYVLEADFCDEDLIQTLQSAFGIETIDVFVTECMLTFVDRDDVSETLERLRGNPAVGVLVHQIQPDPPVAAQEGELDVTLLSPDEWQEACDPQGEDIWRDAYAQLDLPVDETGERT